MADNGKRLFDEVRQRLAVLDQRVGELITAGFERVRSAQRVASVAQGTAMVLVVGVCR